MNRAQDFKNKIHKFFHFGGVIEAITDRIAELTLQQVGTDSILTDEEIRLLRDKERLMRFKNAADSLTGISFEDFFDLRGNEGDDNDFSDGPPSTFPVAEHEIRPAPQPVPTSPEREARESDQQRQIPQAGQPFQTALERVTAAKYSDQFEDHVQEDERLFEIRVIPELLDEAPIHVVQHINMFLRHGVIEETCNTLLRYYARSIPNALTSVNNYTLNRQFPDTQMHHFASINNLLTLFDETRVHFSAPKNGNFRERISVIFPPPAPELEGLLHELANPRTANRLNGLRYTRTGYMIGAQTSSAVGIDADVNL
ncbi:uncharacterized protein B0P05DRAFT_590720 [Gilbertella persicaria]|uniref:uncharacterized protein n=1 Tax=Gilbertella persicaria TaxID=101096 RepID=UPI00221EA3DA|nr:uncharacterized protein B0P05DRAFT_590720 [Gilbertella persicaria]KAI8060613.1 hypothetical protein B0P05DRAFT_590720 [Gilbertella persicaria]